MEFRETWLDSLKSTNVLNADLQATWKAFLKDLQFKQKRKGPGDPIRHCIYTYMA